MVRAQGDLGDGQLTCDGSGGEGWLQLLTALLQEATDVGNTGGALTGASAGQRGALDQFEFVEAAFQDRFEVGDFDASAGAERAVARAWRNVRVASRVAGYADLRLVASHAKERIARVKSESERDRVAFVTLLLAARRLHHHGFDPSLAFETHQLALDGFELDALRFRAEGDDMPEVQPGGGQQGRGSRRHQTM